MTENKVKTIADPVTKEMLVNGLRQLGVSGSQILEVHSSLSSFGYVVGGARTIVDALMEIAEPGGTILMPTQTTENSEPSNWTDPAVPASLYKDIRAAMPAYDSKKTDLRRMGEVVENFRHREGVITSSHPAVSYAAWGRYARLLCNRQSMHFPLAEESPCARLYELKGYVLLMGTGFDTCTCMHLAEYRCDCRPIIISGASMSSSDGAAWKKYLDLDIDSSVFEKVRGILVRKKLIRETVIGGSRIQFFPAAAAIDEAVRYFDKTVVYDLYR
ncbi:MAG: AAC(3) family N-acetyltransferase [Solobacterium sp.]|nr:AAC(3) family N-acetyltransferase [Solobacterium sp.]